jgi:uncharacterized protein (DUF4213/DUF364 family)
MALIEDLVANAGCPDLPVRDMVAGPGWIMVAAAGSGVAARIPEAPPDSSGPETSGTPSMDLATKYGNGPLGDLIGLATSHDLFKASLGVAALNSALSAGKPAARPRSSAIPRAGGKTVVTIGEFAFIEDLKRVADRVIRIDGGQAAGQIPDQGVAVDEALAGADIAIIRGSTLMTGNLESWLDRARHCYTVVYGPSTPLSTVLFEYGADQLVGIHVTSNDVAAGWIREGRGDLLACPGIKPVVMARHQQSR